MNSVYIWVQIVRSNKDTYWYANKIGNIYSVIDDPDRPDKYTVVDWKGNPTFFSIDKESVTEVSVNDMS